MNLTTMIDKYFQLEEAILHEFGFEQDWRVLPLMDYRKYWWAIGDDDVYFDESPFSLLDIDEEKVKYAEQIYRKDNIKRIHDFTLVPVDTNCDGNIWLMILDNEKEVRD